MNFIKENRCLLFLIGAWFLYLSFIEESTATFFIGLSFTFSAFYGLNAKFLRYWIRKNQTNKLT